MIPKTAEQTIKTVVERCFKETKDGDLVISYNRYNTEKEDDPAKYNATTRFPRTCSYVGSCCVVPRACASRSAVGFCDGSGLAALPTSRAPLAPASDSVPLSSEGPSSRVSVAINKATCCSTLPCRGKWTSRRGYTLCLSIGRGLTRGEMAVAEP